jgi:hypothetical protein
VIRSLSDEECLAIDAATRGLSPGTPAHRRARYGERDDARRAEVRARFEAQSVSVSDAEIEAVLAEVPKPPPAPEPEPEWGGVHAPAQAFVRRSREP